MRRCFFVTGIWPARYPSPDADPAGRSKRLFLFIQSVASMVNSMELASIPLWVRFTPPSLRALTNLRLARSAPLLSGPTPLVDRFGRSLRPVVGPKWHCDEVFHKVLGMDRWLFAVMDGATRYILAWDESDTKSGYKPLPLFLAARRLAGLDPWIFVTDGLAAFVKAAPKAFRRREGFRLLHIRDIHLRNIFNTNNIYERLNGEFKARIKTARGFNLKPNKKTDGNLGGGCLAMMRLLIVHHNFFRPHSALNGKTPAEAAGIAIHGDDKRVTMTANAAQA